MGPPSKPERQSKAKRVRPTNGSQPDAAVVPDGRGSLSYETSWQASTIEANTVHKTLQQLWDKIAEERRAAARRPRFASDAAQMRTRTINLIAIADSEEEARGLKTTVTSLTEFFPSRTVILIRAADIAEKNRLAVTVAVEEHPIVRKQSPIRFETITVAASAGREEVLASVASPVLVPELPDFVWYPGASFANSPLLVELIDIADRLIVDTSRVEDPSMALRFLTGLDPGGADGAIHLSDIAWTRLTPWRQLIAQFFDHAATQPCLGAIDDVTITYGDSDADGRTGLTGALLLAGWFCTRLGWRAPGEELVRSKEGWKLTLRAGERGRSREVIVTLRPSTNSLAGQCLGTVAINSGGSAPGHFRIERLSAESIETTSELPSKVNRIVYVRNLDDTKLLSLELRVFGSNQAYQEALAFAANLWPEGVTV